MTTIAWLDTLIMLLVVGVPVAAVLWFLRRPYDQGTIPRDVFASQAKADAVGPGLFVPPTQGFRRGLIDSADDASHDPVDKPDDALCADDNELIGGAERRAQLIASIKRGA